MANFGGWTVIRELGAGGQGVVLLVASPERSNAKASALQKIQMVLSDASAIGRSGEERVRNAHDLALSVADYARPDSHEELGALKKYKIPDGPAGEQARKRFLTEVETLRAIAHPSLLRLIETGLSEHWIITQFCEGQTLHDQLSSFQGQPLKSLKYFRGLVEGVAALHEKQAVHRDIKPQNIFVTGGRLVLGDFGIVFVEGRDASRVTESLERVGTRDWMPPWAHTGLRIDDVKPNFDVFCLGKVLWSMLSGRQMLPYWYFNREPHDLTKVFPNVPDMKIINDHLLAKCVVEDEPKCLADAGQLLRHVDRAIGLIGKNRQIVGAGMQCQLCGAGPYRLLWGKQNEPLRVIPLPQRLSDEGQQQALSHHLLSPRGSLSVRVYSCKDCGHVAMFHFPDGEPPPSWIDHLRNDEPGGS